MSGGVLIPEGVQSQPWNDKPPPLPEGATQKDAQDVALAWKFWADRPTYVKDGNEIVCTVTVRGKAWTGRATITDPKDDSATAWLALHALIVDWLDDTNLIRAARKRLRRG
jgi:hypothetical protein